MYERQTYSFYRLLNRNNNQSVKQNIDISVKFKWYIFFIIILTYIPNYFNKYEDIF